MRLYERAVDFDLMNTINRCYFDADHGRIKLALDRLKDLEDELGENSKICYTEGVLRRDSLMQGVAAFHCFEKALELDPDYENAVVNAAGYAPNEAEFRKYIRLASRLAPTDASLLEKQLAFLEAGQHPYWQRLIGASSAAESAAEGALIELALASGELPEDKELALRSKRFQFLRKADEADQIKRESMGEFFPADERLALHEAMKELDQAIRLDPYDATFWNSKSAWYRLMFRFEESLAAADHAIQLRPSGYPLPYHNKAVVLMKMGKRLDALDLAQTALAQAEASGNTDEARTVRDLIEDLKSPEPVATLEELMPIMARVVKAAQLTANQELSLIKSSTPGQRSSPDEMAALVKRALYSHNPFPTSAMDFVPGMAELLSYFTPETLFMALQQILLEDGDVVQNSLTATLYIAAHEEEIRRRDALRLLLLPIFQIVLLPGGEDQIREQYRKAILEVSAAASDEMADLDRLMREELERIHPDLPALIADQKPVDASGVARAQRIFLSKLQGEPYVTKSRDKSGQSGSQAGTPGNSCLTSTLVLIFAGIGIVIGILAKNPWFPGATNWLVGGSGGALAGYVFSWLFLPRRNS
jgi:tetratricopeptide (TPR) repeat protein